MTDLRERLLELESRWVAAGTAVDEIFGPGLDPMTIEATLSEAGLGASAEIVQWFSWHNGGGDPPNGDSPLGPTMWTALSLREAMKTRDERVRMAVRNTQEINLNTLPSYWWDDSWLPIAEDGGQGVLAVALWPGAIHSAVRYVIWSDGDFRTVREDSIAELVEVWVAILKRGGWTWSESSRLWEGDFSSLPTDLAWRSLM